jgi:hypothetical protein
MCCWCETAAAAAAAAAAATKAFDNEWVEDVDDEDDDDDDEAEPPILLFNEFTLLPFRFKFCPFENPLLIEPKLAALPTPFAVVSKPFKPSCFIFLNAPS